MSEHPYTRHEDGLVYAITQQALDACAATAASRIEGVSLAEHRLRRPRGRGAEVVVGDQYVEARLAIRCRYGIDMPDAARRVQVAVAAALRRLTTMDVERVDVDVVAVTRT